MPQIRKYPTPDVKQLWALSAGRCNYPSCRTVCVIKSTRDGQAIVGDIAHVIAHSASGPRFDATYSTQSLDSYDNWILLCPNHHRLVDSLPSAYPTQVLRRWKLEHELWVHESLQTPTAIITAPAPKVTTLWRVHRASADPLEVVLLDPPGGRYDDPYGGYPVLYTAGDPVAAIAELLSRLGPHPAVAATLANIGGPETGPPAGPLARSVLSMLANSHLTRLSVRGSLVDAAALFRERWFAEALRARLGLDEADPTPTSVSRRASQEASRILWENVQGNSLTDIVGIAYPSRVLNETELYGVFIGQSPVCRVQETTRLLSSPYLRDAIRLLGLDMSPDIGS